MAKETNAKGSNPSFLKDITQWMIWIASRFKPLLSHFSEDLEARFDHYFRLIEKRLLWLAVGAAMITLCVSITVLGVIFMLIDFLSFPRGIACLSCGLFVALILVFLLKTAK